MHREANLYAHGVAGHFDMGMLFSHDTVLEHRRLGLHTEFSEGVYFWAPSGGRHFYGRSAHHRVALDDRNPTLKPRRTALRSTESVHSARGILGGFPGRPASSTKGLG